ncbi:hypothetical protein ATE84_0237 [Aquimarina sp. MAR_2010_214]|uniref:DUF6438 domain-containing protein n=1 Tax=Aquimarina sp. MAR_2010_214 TaxID=1250026 RepID=UPI000C710F6B|nr:DUF6438 domain-containing protein [Aquimarina sp. MAR_2010_214]PKV48242.1 hypothetical protein ATE84_0237 [Aquimarina sp. MAR_2010_214]
MKCVMMILIMVGFSCQSTKSTSANVSKDEALVYYSKGPCLGKCPVYDLWIYHDGSISYSGINHVSVKGNISRKLEEQELKELKRILNKDSYGDRVFKKIRDRPITTLRFNGKEYKYYSNKIDGALKEIDVKLKNVMNNIVLNHENKEG